MVNEGTPTVETEDQLPGMPPSFELCLEAVGDSVVVSYGGRALAVYESGDQGMRNLAIVSLTRAGSHAQADPEQRGRPPPPAPVVPDART